MSGILRLAAAVAVHFAAKRVAEAGFERIRERDDARRAETELQPPAPRRSHLRVVK